MELLQLRREALDRLLGPLGSGEWIEDSKVSALLERLGCSLQAQHDEDGQISRWSVEVPPARQLDLQREVDLIEEIARLVGYDNFGSHLPDPVEPGGLTPEQECSDGCGRICGRQACRRSVISHWWLVKSRATPARWPSVTRC